MDDEEIRLECIRLAQMNTKDVGGSMHNLSADEVVGRAMQYFKFVSDNYFEDGED